MALSNKGKLIALWAAVVAVVGVSIVAMESKEKARTKAKKTKGTPKDPLAGVYEQGALLPEAVSADIMLPVYLTMAPPTKPTPMVTVVDGTVNDPSQLAVLITNIASAKAQLAYDTMLALAIDGHDFSEPGTLDAAVQTTVQTIAPKVDWSQGLSPYSFTSPEALIWRGTQMLGELAHQSYWNKNAAPSA